MQPTEHSPAPSRAQRAVSYGYGVFFLALGLLIFVVADFSLGTVLAGLAVAGLGVDAIVSTLRNKKSVLARIGPLP